MQVINKRQVKRKENRSNTAALLFAVPITRPPLPEVVVPAVLSRLSFSGYNICGQGDNAVGLFLILTILNMILAATNEY